MTLTVVAVTVLTWRLTRLVTADEFPPVKAARERVVLRGPAWLGYLVRCAWCASPYVAAGVVATLLAAGVDMRMPVLVWALAAALSPVLALAVMLVEALIDLARTFTPKRGS